MGCYFYFVCLFLVGAIGVPSSSSSSFSSHIFISGDVLKDHRYAGRNLLQATQKCPLNFEFANYTILTSKCKGPDYPAKQCCAALGDFACQYAKFINDPSYDCSAIMFSYIDQRTDYEHGLFASECREDIPCPGVSPTSSPSAADDDDAFFVIPLQILISVFILLYSSLPLDTFYQV
ncbi:putative GPI-anchored protein LORELEI [Dioscorea sansibarensis]